jgi:DNA-binding NarL/FixJ family response regulator
VSDKTTASSVGEPARLLIVDDHELVRSGLLRVLSREEALTVVGEAENGRQAVKLCRTLRPDLVLMDVRMPEMDGIAATRTIKQELPATIVLVVTTYDSPDYLLEAVEAGAAGYVLKDTPKDRLLNTVRRALEGESPLNQELAMQLIQRLAKEHKERLQEPAIFSVAEDTALASLTARELEVLRVMARGVTNAQIAAELFISPKTAKTHVQHIIAKLGVSDRTQAVVRAIEAGIVVPGVPEKRSP